MPSKICLSLLSLFLTLCALEAGLRAAGRIVQSRLDRQKRDAIKIAGAYRILCLGESTTAMGGNDSYPDQLERKLNSMRLGINFSVVNGGKIGVNSTRLVAGLDREIAECRPDMVVVMMGINDEGTPLVRKESDQRVSRSILASLRIYKLGRLMFSKLAGVEDGIVNELMVQEEAKNIHKMAASIRDTSTDALLSEAWSERLAGNSGKAARLFRQALQKNATNDAALAGLAGCIDGEEAEQCLVSALQFNPGNELALCQMADMHLYRKNDPEKAELYFLRALALNPSNDWALIETASLRLKQGDAAASADLLVRSTFARPDSDWAYGRLAALFGRTGRPLMAERCLDRANSIREQRFNPATESNYGSMVRNLQRRGIAVVCMQYPTRSTRSLLKMLGNEPGVLIADNEQPFRSAIITGRADEYFTDLFGGEFGHCTAAGNAAIAEHAAGIIAATMNGQSSP
ncbi:MAG: hypothetical protein C0404_04380 [Verrucomicrobia bacterium]|nr:hypothetical protein [Verrucomicrobiota bacterium]